MIWKSWLQLISVALVVVLAACLAVAWRAQQSQQAALQVNLKAARSDLAQVQAREAARRDALQQQIAQLEKNKASVKRPDKVLKALPSLLPLPEPLVVEQNPGLPPQSGSLSNAESPVPKVSLPTQDLKPLYDFAVDCKECQARLAAAQASLQDEQAKTATVSRELAAALRVAKGGSPLTRVARATKWFVLGAAAGAIAAKFAH